MNKPTDMIWTLIILVLAVFLLFNNLLIPFISKKMGNKTAPKQEEKTVELPAKPASLYVIR